MATETTTEHGEADRAAPRKPEVSSGTSWRRIMSLPLLKKSVIMADVLGTPGAFWEPGSQGRCF
jgi:hypothetical protein